MPIRYEQPVTLVAQAALTYSDDQGQPFADNVEATLAANHNYVFLPLLLRE